ncbi:hypothetical protein V8F20_001283 [Naviculisporaceae sp. PSN 640]
MAEVNSSAGPPQDQSWADPKAAPGSEEPWMVHTPVWHVVLRGFQVFFAFVIVVMAGVLIHGHSMDANAFALVCGLFTWIIVTYALVTEKVAGAHKGYNIWAILSLDLFIAIFWLASMGANAALRATFTEKVSVSCYNDGSAISSNKCTYNNKVKKRAAVADDVGLALMSAIAGLSALNWLLFIATLVFNGHTFRLYYQANRTPKQTDNATVEMKAQETPMLDAQQHQPVAPSYPQYTDQQQYAQQYQPQNQTQMAPAPQPTPSPGPVPSQSPAPQYGYNPGYGQPQQQQQPYYEAPGNHPHSGQSQEYPPAGYPQTYAPSSPPVQGQPYYPPAQ